MLSVWSVGKPYLIGLCKVAGDLGGSTAVLLYLPDAGSDCAPALRHSPIIFCTRTQGHCNQHGMGEGIMG